MKHPIYYHRFFNKVSCVKLTTSNDAMYSERNWVWIFLATKDRRQINVWGHGGT